VNPLSTSVQSKPERDFASALHLPPLQSCEDTRAARLAHLSGKLLCRRVVDFPSAHISVVHGDLIQAILEHRDASIQWQLAIFLDARDDA
jgi:hypothetical protein